MHLYSSILTPGERLGGVGEGGDGVAGGSVQQGRHDGPVAAAERAQAVQQGGVQAQHQPPPRAGPHAPHTAPFQLSLSRRNAIIEALLSPAMMR